MRIFIGYRRDDAGGTAGRIYDRLVDHYGREHVFRDVDALDAGVDFVQAVEVSIADADVMLIVIGPDWLTITDPTGRRRLDVPDDHVRAEVRLALGRENLRIIPVTVDGARMPAAADLPADLAELAFRNAVEVRGTRFDDDVSHLVTQIGGGRGLAAWLRRHVVVSSVAGVALVAGALLLTNSVLAGAEPLSGDFNFAVAEFSATGEAQPDDARGLSDAAFSQITEVLAAFEASGDFTNLDVAEPATVGSIDGGSTEQRVARAQHVAADLNADVMLLGNLDVGGGVSRFDAEVYLSERNLRNAEELAGAYSLGRVELNTTDPVAVTREVTRIYRAQATAIAELVVGLSYYSVNDYPTAYTHLVAAEEAWQGASGREVVLQMLGNVAGELGSERWDEAREHFAAALAINPGYARARFGIAEVDFLAARGAECSGDESREPANPGALESVVEEFRRVADMEAPPLSFLDLRAQVEIGRVYLCLSLIGGRDALENAERELSAVVDAYDGTNERLRDIVSLAYRGLALHDIQLEDYHGALDRYQKAIDLSLDPSEEGTLWASRGDVYSCLLGDPDAAEAEYARAAGLVDGAVPRAEC